MFNLSMNSLFAGSLPTAANHAAAPASDSAAEQSAVGTESIGDPSQLLNLVGSVSDIVVAAPQDALGVGEHAQLKDAIGAHPTATNPLQDLAIGEGLEPTVDTENPLGQSGVEAIGDDAELVSSERRQLLLASKTNHAFGVASTDTVNTTGLAANGKTAAGNLPAEPNSRLASVNSSPSIGLPQQDAAPAEEALFDLPPIEGDTQPTVQQATATATSDHAVTAEEFPDRQIYGLPPVERSLRRYTRQQELSADNDLQVTDVRYQAVTPSSSESLEGGQTQLGNPEGQAGHSFASTTPQLSETLIAAPQDAQSVQVQPTSDAVTVQPAVSTAEMPIAAGDRIVESGPGSLNSVTQTKPSADSATIAPDVPRQVVRAVTQAIEPAGQEAVRTVSLELQPKELGHLTIRIEQTAELISAQIIANEQISSELLSGQKDSLTEALIDLGFDEASVDISHQQRDPDESDSNRIESGRTGNLSGQAKQQTQINQSSAVSDGLNIVA